MATGVVAVDVMVVVSVAAVWEDLVVLLQPLRANPASIKVNNIVLFIGGLSCASTDRGLVNRFATHLDAKTARRKTRARCEPESGRARRATGEDVLPIVLARNDEAKCPE
jgi:hypothetical protein